MQRGRHVKSQTTSPTVLPLEHDYSKLKDGSARTRVFFLSLFTRQSGGQRVLPSQDIEDTEQFHFGLASSSRLNSSSKFS